MQTQTANIGAFQVEKQAEVGVAGANAIGQMGASGASDANLGGSDGLNMVAIMVGMAVGNAVGQNIASNMSNLMNGTLPPPIPAVMYHVAVNGHETEPFDMITLQQMKILGQLTSESLVWKQGMADWVLAGTVNELKPLFEDIIPPQLPK